MYIDNIEFINTPVTKYLKEMIVAFGYTHITLEMQPLASYLFANTFIQMTGFLEKKFDTIVWELGNNDISYRYEILHPNTKFPLFSSYDNIKNYVYNRFKTLEIAEEHQNKPKDAKDRFFSMNEYCNSAVEAYEDIYNLFDKTKIKNECFNQDFFDYEKLRENISKSEKQPQTLLKTIYEDTISYRNRIAHNLSSINPEIPSIKHLQNKKNYDNYYARFMILRYMDLVFTNLFNKYIEQIQKEHIRL